MTGSGSSDPTPVRVVGSWRSSFPGAIYQLLLVAAGVVLAVWIAPWEPALNQIIGGLHFVEPTCEDPKELTRLDVLATAKVTVSSSQEPEKTPGWRTTAMFDGRPGSGWVPETQSVREGEEVSLEKWPPGDDGEKIDHPRINVKFPEKAERVRLLCIINGNGADLVSYTSADRVRTAKVVLLTDEKAEPKFAPLRTLPEYEIQNRQMLWVKPPGTGPDQVDEIDIEIIDRYLGSTVLDPQTGRYKFRGTGKLMVAELEIYVEN